MRKGHATSSRSAPSRRGRPRGIPSGATKQRILAAAWECFGARGYQSTTNRDIGDRAGVTGAAIYQHFDSKLVLYTEAVRAAHREIVPFFRDAVTGAQSAREAFGALTQAYVAAYERFPTLTAFLSGIPVEMHRHAEIANAILMEPDTVLPIIADIVERAISNGEIERGQSAAVISMFLATTMGLSLQATLSGKTGLVEAADAYRRLLDGTLFGNAHRKSVRARRRIG
jgi:AcrR family transcriptional regulator